MLGYQRLLPNPSYIIFVILFLFLAKIYVSNNHPNSRIDYFVTAKGKKHLNEVVENVFKWQGYSLVKNDLIPVLKKTIQISCNDVFFEWQKISKNSKPMLQAPRELINPDSFLLNKYAKLSHYYCDQLPKNNENVLPVWEENLINDYVNKAKINPNEIPATYGKESIAVYMATKYFNINDQNGAVIGSLSPWVEAYLLANGAKHVTTIEYQKIKISHPQLSFLYAPDLPSKQKIYNNHFDFVVSFSSIEHSGLGRFGDPLDPIGDIREMNKVRCLLKNGGLFFVGINIGADEIEYNAHRIYGRMRLAMMFEGFEILQVFYGDETKPIIMNQDILESKYSQYLFVLQKR